ncbi:MAG: hypothetical protein AAGC60_18450 [Acidobacteriota bacterium]
MRAERDGGDNGCVYEISFAATGGGASADGSVTDCVPHDRSGAGCVDDGRSYDSTVP